MRTHNPEMAPAPVRDAMAARAPLRVDVQALMATLGPLNATISGLHAEIKDLRDRIPGI